MKKLLYLDRNLKLQNKTYNHSQSTDVLGTTHSYYVSFDEEVFLIAQLDTVNKTYDAVPEMTIEEVLYRTLNKLPNAMDNISFQKIGLIVSYTVFVPVPAQNF